MQCQRRIVPEKEKEEEEELHLQPADVTVKMRQTGIYPGPDIL